MPTTYGALKPSSDGMETEIPLIPMERSAVVQMLPPITTVTFFRGNVNEATAYVRDRVGAIVEANPWLSSRLCKSKSTDERGNIVMMHRLDASLRAEGDGPSYFVVDSTMQLSSSMSWNVILNTLQTIDLETGSAAVKSGSPGFKVTFVPDQEVSDAFALIVSLSHVFGDGDTYYRILGMLAHDAPVISLDPKRNPQYPQAAIDLLGEVEEGYTRSFGYTCGFLAAVCRMSCCGCSRPRAYPHVFEVNKPFVERMKKHWQEETMANAEGQHHVVRYISSNDILSSWFFDMAKADVGLMAINLRRSEQSERCGVSGTSAGNYENLLTFRPEDYDTPVKVRLAVEQLKRAGGGSLPLPLYEQLSARTAVISNWASFFNGLDLMPNVRQVLHLPMLAAPPIQIDFAAACIFRPRKDELAMWVLAPGFDPEEVRASSDAGRGGGPVGAALGPNSNN